MKKGRNITSLKEEPTLHGGTLDLVRARYGDVNEPWIDLSTGINPAAYPFCQLDQRVWTRLPMESQLNALLSSAAERYRAPSFENIVACPGSQAAIQVIPRLIDAKNVVIVGPTYEEHLRSWRRVGCNVSLTEGLDEALQLRADVVVVVNPNNPTGRIYSGECLLEVAGKLALQGGVLVVDEAFCDLCGDGVSLVPSLPENAVVLRSFGKTYGLAGLRLGFVVSNVSFARKLRCALGPWAVSGPACEIGRGALGDDQWINEQRAKLLGDVERLKDILEQAGFRIIGETPLFVLASIDGANGSRDRLAKRGIHVRHFPKNPTWLRFGIPGVERDWDRLATCLAAPRKPADLCNPGVE